jgi:hypothetical protein
MGLLQRTQRAIPAPSQRFVVHQDFPVCQMEYVEREIPFKWAPVRTSLGLGEAVLNTAVCQSSEEEYCTWADFHEAAGSNNIAVCKPQSKGNYCCGTGSSCCSGPGIFHLGILAKASTLPFATITSTSKTASSTTGATSSSTASATSTSLSTQITTSSQTSMSEELSPIIFWPSHLISWQVLLQQCQHQVQQIRLRLEG